MRKQIFCTMMPGVVEYKLSGEQYNLYSGPGKYVPILG